MTAWASGARGVGPAACVAVHFAASARWAAAPDRCVVLVARCVVSVARCAGLDAAGASVAGHRAVQVPQLPPYAPDLCSRPVWPCVAVASLRYPMAGAASLSAFLNPRLG